MLHKQIGRTALSLICVFSFWGCPSEEYTSAKLYLQQKDYPKAEEFLVKAMAVEVDNPEIPFQLGHHIYGRDGRWKEMNEVFDKAMDLNPEAKIMDGRTVKEMVDVSRYGFWSDEYNRGVRVYNSSKGLNEEDRNNKIREALEVFRTASVIKFDESLNYTMMATCFYEIGDSESAGEHISKAVEIAPEDFNANIAAGQIFSRNNEPEKALPYLTKAVELDPTNSAAIRNLAQTHYDLGDTDASIATYEKAISTTTDMKVKADLYFNLGVLYNLAGDFDTAEDNFVSALDLNPNDVEAIVGMAQTFESNEKWRKAEKFYKELIYLEPEVASHYRGIARVLLQQGKQDEATRYFEKSKKYD